MSHDTRVTGTQTIQKRIWVSRIQLKSMRSQRKAAGGEGAGSSGGGSSGGGGSSSSGSSGGRQCTMD